MLVSRFAQKVTSYGLKDKVARVNIAVDPRVLGEFADLNQVAALLNESSDTDLTQEEISAKKAFLRAKARVDRGEDPNLPDFLE